MADNVETPIEMLVDHGRNTSDRLVQEILLALSELINGKEIMVDGKLVKLKPLGGTGVKEQNGEYRLLFDVLQPTGFDHIEFKVTKTGWGR